MQILLTNEEAAALLHVSKRTLYKWRKKRAGPPCHRAGHRLLYDREELLLWVKRQPEQRPEITP